MSFTNNQKSGSPRGDPLQKSEGNLIEQIGYPLTLRWLWKARRCAVHGTFLPRQRLVSSPSKRMEQFSAQLLVQV